MTQTASHSNDRNRGPESIEDAETSDSDSDTTTIDLETKILEVVDEKLIALKRSILGPVGELVATRVEELVELRVRKAVGSASRKSLDPRQIQDAVTSAFSSNCVESGLLESLVTRIVDTRLDSRLPAAFEAREKAQDKAQDVEAVAGRVQNQVIGTVKKLLGESLEVLDKELRALVQKEAASILASDSLKELLDDKFRTISMYLKTDVIPRAVAQGLKGTRPGATPTAP